MKRKIVSQILSVLLGAVVLTTGLSGCGGDGEEPTAELSGTQPMTAFSKIDPSNVTELSSLADSSVEPSEQPSSTKPTTDPKEKTEETKETAVRAPSAPIQKEKKGDLYKVVGANKIWANLIGEAYILFKNTEEPTASGISGKVYELYVLVAQTGDDYMVWSDGYWDLNDAGDTLTLTPHNQNENGNIGVAAGEKKTYAKSGNAFQIKMSFSGGGKVTFLFDPSADALQ
ncbi:MAG TPA: hypothetical protein IAD07_04015 [Candidatus Fimivicinus intestinavium]|nr:hypothetical protein [Candidatus Fimivicinus intestinavium]